MHNFLCRYCNLGPLVKTRGPLGNLFHPLFSPSHVSNQSYFLLLGGRPQVTRMPEWQFLFWVTSSLCISVWKLSNNSCCPWQQVTVNLQSVEKGKKIEKYSFIETERNGCFHVPKFIIFLSTTPFDLFALDHDPWCAESNRQTSRHARNTLPHCQITTVSVQSWTKKSSCENVLPCLPLCGQYGKLDFGRVDFTLWLVHLLPLLLITHGGIVSLLFKTELSS